MCLYMHIYLNASVYIYIYDLNMVFECMCVIFIRKLFNTNNMCERENRTVKVNSDIE